MGSFRNFLCAAPRPLAEFGAKWPGWQVVTGRDVPRFGLPGLHDTTMTPCKYGFHGAVKSPFRPKDGQTPEALEKAVTDLDCALSPAACDGLNLTQLGHFLALTPFGTRNGLQQIAKACVRDLDGFRAPANEAELARRRKAGLSPWQEALPNRSGYPCVFEGFQFHLTLPGRLPEDKVRGYVPDLPTPHVVDQIVLCGERQNGRFDLVHRYTLTD